LHPASACSENFKQEIFDLLSVYNGLTFARRLAKGIVVMNHNIQRQPLRHGLNLPLAVSIGVALTAGLLVGERAVNAADSAATTSATSSANTTGVTTYSYTKRGSVKSSTLTPPPMPSTPKADDAKKTTTTTTTTSTSKAVEEAPIVQQSKKIVSTNPKVWQVFRENFTLQPGQNTMPLTLRVTNGEGGKSEFQAIQVAINNAKFAEQKEFKGPNLAKGLTGLTPGLNQVLFQAYGPVGAKLTWKIVTSKFSVDSVDPTDMGPSDVVSVKGKGFTPSSTITIGGKSVRLTSTSPSLIKFSVNDDLPVGKQDLLVTAGGVTSKAFKVNVKIAPEVTGVDQVATATGQPLTVYGKHFSPNASENQITFTTTQGQTYTASASSATETQVVVTVPEIEPNPTWNVMVKCKTNGVESKTGNVSFNIGLRVIPNDGVPQQ
jgi:hypothetical protein